MDASALKAWRATLLVILAAECTLLLASAWTLALHKPATLGTAWAGFLATRALFLAPLYALTLVGVYGFLGPRGRLRWGGVALFGMAASFQVFSSVYAVHHQDFFQSGAVLLGFVLGEAYARLLGVREEESPRAWLDAKTFGLTGGVAMLAGTYLAAGTSKLMHGGLAWLTSSTLRLMVASHTEVDAVGAKAILMHAIAESPRLCAALEVGTIVVQLGAFMLLAGPRARRLWATLLVFFHLGIYLSSNILFLQPLLLLLSLLFPWAAAASFARRITGRPAFIAEEPAAPVPARERGTWAALAMAVVLLLWLGSLHG